jgi:hypothetical protein
MIDPEVARLRRLRDEALLVRQVARTFESSQWAANESLLDRCGCASWRIARVISGRLRGHPYAEYQKDATAVSRGASALRAYCLSLTHNSRAKGLAVLETHVNALSRLLDDAICLAWSSDFSEALSRAHSEIKSLSGALAKTNRSGEVQERPAMVSSRSDRMVGDIGPTLEGDWPYLAL